MSRHGTRGKCIFCQNDYTRTGMTRHLETCKTRKAAIAAASAPGIRLFHLTVQGTYNAAYWMNLEIPASATLQDLDSFLRGIWVECCGHLSSFEIDQASCRPRISPFAWAAGSSKLRKCQFENDAPQY